MSAQPPPSRPSRLRQIANWLAFTWTVLGIFFAVLIMLPGRPNPLPFGPGRIHVQVDDVAIRAVPAAMLFKEFNADDRVWPPRDVLAFRISSEIELIERLDGGGKEIQVRCVVEGNADGWTYRGVSPGLAPLADLEPDAGRVRSTGPAPLRHRYAVYAFIDLVAVNDRNGVGASASRLDLERESFESLRCRILGVNMGGLWPGTSALVVSQDEFRVMQREAQMR